MSDETDNPQDGTVDGATVESDDLDLEAVDAETLDDEVVVPEVVDDAGAATDAPREVTTDPESGFLGAAFGGADDLARERDGYLDALRRLQADFENYRKQTLRRQGEQIDYATGRLVEDLLAVLDACDAGIEHGDEGVNAIFVTLLGVLEKSGLERLDPLGEPFDPNTHEAVLHEPAAEGDDADGPTVVEVLRPGYRWKERTLRAAMVKVRG